MQTITVVVPDMAELNPRDTIRFLAAKLYEAGRLTLGQAAEMCSMSKVAFAEILGDYGVSLINYPVNEMKRDAAKL
jgi:predicted HTH domain antitoxin